MEGGISGCNKTTPGKRFVILTTAIESERQKIKESPKMWMKKTDRERPPISKLKSGVQG
jgi:hypothetical protein